MVVSITAAPPRCCPSPRRRHRQGTVSRVSKCLHPPHLRPTPPGSSMYVPTHLPDILVPDFADLLDVGSALRDSLNRVTAEDELILLGLGDLDVDTVLHRHPPDDLLADEVAVRHPAVSLVSLSFPCGPDARPACSSSRAPAFPTRPGDRPLARTGSPPRSCPSRRSCPG